MIIQRILLTILCSVAFFNQQCLHGFSLRSIVQQTKETCSKIFGPKIATDIWQQEIARTTQKKLIVNNPYGSIKIKTDWAQDTISIKAEKKAPEEKLKALEVQTESTPDTITIKAVCAQEDTSHSTVKYTLMVPKQMIVQLHTTGGAIKVNQFDGPLSATSETGSIKICHVNNRVQATVHEHGSITLDHINGPIHAKTACGTITINHAKDSINALAPSGAIDVSAACIPTTGSLCLTCSDDITLRMPESINAHLRAQADHGTVISDHAVTLTTKTTKLNSKAWDCWRKNIEGTIGSGEATIALQSDQGSINVLVA